MLLTQTHQVTSTIYYNLTDNFIMNEIKPYKIDDNITILNDETLDDNDKEL